MQATIILAEEAFDAPWSIRPRSAELLAVCGHRLILSSTARLSPIGLSVEEDRR